MMNITNAKPPIYDEANELFKLEENNINAVFTYGTTIYNPFGCGLTPELIRHEETHMEQQEGHSDVAAVWWKRYLQDPEFRVDQEAEAYGAQYKLFCQREKDRNKRAKYLHEIARMLSGPMYGNIITQAQAMVQIRTYSEHPMM